MTGFLRHHLRLKLIALGLAFFVWFLVGSEAPGFRIGELPVVYKLPATGGLELVDSPTTEVEVRIEGPRGALARAFQDNAVVIDLRDAGAGKRTVLLSEENLQSRPAGCTVQIVPDRLRLELDARVEREVPFVETVTGAPPAGYVVAEITTRPPTVWVTGPASALADQDVHVLSDPVDLSGLDADGTAEQHLIRVGAAPNVPGVRLLQPVDFRVVVEIREERARITRKVPVAGTPSAVESDPPQVTVVIEGYRSRAEAFFVGLEARVDSDGVAGPWTTRPVALERDPAAFAVELLSLRPEQVRVRALAPRGSGG